jgi:cytochrome bd-type quinol oxidase subunit 2
MKKILIIFLMLVSAMVPLMLNGRQMALADTKSEIIGGVCEAAGTNTTDAQGNPACDASSSPGNVGSTIKTIVNLLSVVAGVAAVIMIIVAGLRYVTSGGKEEGIKNAKNTIMYAIIGLVIVALAQLIVHFVLHNTNKATSGAAPSSKPTSSTSSSSGSSSGSGGLTGGSSNNNGGLTGASNIPQ